MSSTAERARAASDELGVDQSFGSLEVLLADAHLDVVHILTADALHEEQALAVIAAGKHVVCEKPLGITVEEAKRMKAAAARAGVTATVSFAYRYHPIVREARARVQAGEVGRLFSIHGVPLQGWPLDRDDNSWRVDASS